MRSGLLLILSIPSPAPAAARATSRSPAASARSSSTRRSATDNSSRSPTSTATARSTSWRRFSLTDAVHVYVNAGEGGFDAISISGPGIDRGARLVTLDVDGDADLDVAAVGLTQRKFFSVSAGEIVWYENPGDPRGSLDHASDLAPRSRRHLLEVGSAPLGRLLHRRGRSRRRRLARSGRSANGTPPTSAARSSATASSGIGTGNRWFHRPDRDRHQSARRRLPS